MSTPGTPPNPDEAFMHELDQMLGPVEVAIDDLVRIYRQTAALHGPTLALATVQTAVTVVMSKDGPNMVATVMALLVSRVADRQELVEDWHGQVGPSQP